MYIVSMIEISRGTLTCSHCRSRVVPLANGRRRSTWRGWIRGILYLMSVKHETGVANAQRCVLARKLGISMTRMRSWIVSVRSFSRGMVDVKL